MQDYQWSRPQIRERRRPTFCLEAVSVSKPSIHTGGPFQPFPWKILSSDHQIYIQYAGGKEDKISVATGLYSTNYKAKAEVLKTAAAHIEASTHASPNVVLLTDALSVLQALQSNRDTELNDLSTALASLCRRHAVTLQWIPSHCNLPGNEAADFLAKEGTTKEYVDRSTSYPEVKTILKAKQHSRWRHKHPRYNKADPYYLLTRREQVTVFRLRTGHNRLNYHLYSKLRIGHTEQCPCGTGSQTTEHLLQSYPTFEPLRKGIWPDHTPVARKLYGSLRDLRCTATFIGETGVSIWRTRRRRRSPESFEFQIVSSLWRADHAFPILTFTSLEQQSIHDPIITEVANIL